MAKALLLGGRCGGDDSGWAFTMTGAPTEAAVRKAVTAGYKKFGYYVDDLMDAVDKIAPAAGAKPGAALAKALLDSVDDAYDEENHVSARVRKASFRELTGLLNQVAGSGARIYSGTMSLGSDSTPGFIAVGNGTQIVVLATAGCN